MLKPGDPGTPVPGGTHVFRLARADSSSGEPSYTAFELSEADRRQNPPRLSVWLSELTLPHQARSLLQNAEQYQFALHLATDTIRSLHSRLPTNGAPVTPLDVVWDPLSVTPPGYSAPPAWLSGHCGITGLLRPPGMPREAYKALRVLLLKESQIERLTP